jgi:small subunit ribosomal protein S6
MYIMDPGLSEEDLGAAAERFRQVVISQGGAVQHLEKWERRRLAYEVKGKREGTYYLLNFTGDPGVEAELGRVLGLTENVLRHMVVRLDDLALKHMEAQAKLRQQQQAAAAAQAAAEAAAQAAAPPVETPPAPAAVAAAETRPAEPETTEPPTTEADTDEATEADVAASEDTEES